MLGGMPKSQEKIIAEIKWVCPIQNNEKGQIKEEQQKKRWKIQRVELRIVILSLWNLETLFESYKSFSFMAKNQNLHYIPIKVYSNQASKQPGTINDALKMQRVFFIGFMTLRTNYLLLFMLIKWLFKKRQFFLKQNLELFLEPFTLKPTKAEGHLMMYFHRQ